MESAFSIFATNKTYMSLEREISIRRTFGIISHPDAGKTTLTEKLLLFGGAIQEAGAVKSNKVKKSATSDFMEIEKQRGISVATSVMGFYYKDKKINILDTPGHQDFAEDTYRTLTGVESYYLKVFFHLRKTKGYNLYLHLCLDRYIFVKLHRFLGILPEILDPIADHTYS